MTHPRQITLGGTIRDPPRPLLADRVGGENFRHYRRPGSRTHTTIDQTALKKTKIDDPRRPVTQALDGGEDKYISL